MLIFSISGILKNNILINIFINKYFILTQLFNRMILKLNHNLNYDIKKIN